MTALLEDQVCKAWAVHETGLNRRRLPHFGDGAVGLEGQTGAAGPQATRAGGNWSMLGLRQ